MPGVGPAPGWTAALTSSAGTLDAPALTGCDGLGTVPLPGGRVAWLAADSWIGAVIDGHHAPGSAMVNNAVGVHAINADGAPPDPASVHWVWGPPPRPGKRSAWVMPPEAGTWCWPAGGGIVAPGPDGRDRLVLFFADITSAGDESAGVWNFKAAGTRVAIVDNPGEGPERWWPRQVRLPTRLSRGEGAVMWGNAVVAGAAGAPGDLLVFGLDAANPLDKAAVVARVAPGRVEDFEAWRFWTGGGWSADEADARPMARGVSDEYSVDLLGVGESTGAGLESGPDQTGRETGPTGPAGLWVMIHSEAILGPRILARTARSPLGPWSEPAAVFTAPEPATDARLFAYAAKAHPELSPRGTLLVHHCVNSHDFWHAAGDASVYRPRFVAVPLGLLPDPPDAP